MLNNKDKAELYDKSSCKDGVLFVEYHGKYYWASEQDYFSPDWTEISEHLYNAIVIFSENAKTEQ